MFQSADIRGFANSTVGVESVADLSNKLIVLQSFGLQELAVLPSDPTQLCSRKLLLPFWSVLGIFNEMVEII